MQLSARRGNLATGERLLRACLDGLRQIQYGVLYTPFLGLTPHLASTAAMRPCTGIAPEFKFAGYSLLEGGEWGDAVALGKFQRPDRGNEVCTRLTAGGNRIRTFGTAEDAGVLAGLRVWIAPIPAVPVCEIGPLESTPLNHSWPVSIRQRPQSGDVWPTWRLPHFAVGSPGDVPPRCAARKGRVFASASLAAGSLYSSQLPR